MKHTTLTDLLSDPGLARKLTKGMVVKTEDECWPWMGNKDRLGRGRMWINGTNKHHSVPRIVLALSSVTLPPPDIFACHSCDDPGCVNPKHLWWGTRSDNMKDCGAKGRHGQTIKHSGSNNHNAKLSEDDVRIIRIRRQNGESLAVIAQDFDVLPQTVSCIVNRRSWKHV